MVKFIMWIWIFRRNIYASASYVLIYWSCCNHLVMSVHQYLSDWCVCAQFSSVQFSSRWYLCAWKSPYALHPICQKFPQHRLWNDSNVWLIDDGPLSSFQGRLSSISSLMHMGGRCVCVCISVCVYQCVCVCVCVFPEWFRLIGKPFHNGC